MTYDRMHVRRGFTLVELLVVIGIIALLVSILLPSLAAARQQAQSIKCLSNMRQIAMAAATYTSQSKGYLLPADINDPDLAGEAHGRSWSDTWATILVAEKLLPYPRNTGATVPPTGSDNVFHCPSGELEIASITSIKTGLPKSRKDRTGAMGYLNQSSKRGLEPGLNVFCWYGINGSASSTTRVIPFRRVAVSGGRIVGYAKSSEVRKATEFVFIFDGVLGLHVQSTNANRLNARHNNQTMTNIAFLDGHAESWQTKNLPGGDGDANKDPGPNAAAAFNPNGNLKKFPYPQWRLDQQ